MSYIVSDLQIRKGTENNAKIIFIISHQNIYCEPSLEPPLANGSNEGSQHMFLCRNTDNYPLIIGDGRVVR